VEEHPFRRTMHLSPVRHMQNVLPTGPSDV